MRGSERCGVDAALAPEALPRALLEAAPIGIAVVAGADNHLEVMNPVYCRLLGAPEDGAVGRPLRDLLPEPTGLAADGNIAEVYRSRRTLTVREIPLKAAEPPGTTYWDVTYAPLPAEGKPVEGVLMLAVPVTGQVRARQETDQRAAQLQAVLGAISDGVAVFDAEGRPVYVNRALAQRAGIEGAEGRQGTPEALLAVQTFWPDGTPLRREDWLSDRALRGETIAAQELQFKLPREDRRRWARVSAAPVRDASGHITGAVMTGIDITAQKEAQAERERLLAQLQAAHENLLTVLNQLPDGVLVLDATQHVTSNNDTIRRYVGRDLVGMELADLRYLYGFVSPSGQPFAPGQAPLDRALRGEPATGVAVRIHLRDGCWLDALESAAPLRGADGELTGAVVALTDITPLRAAEAERERLLAEVQGARQNLRAILDQLPEGVLVVNPSLHVTLANEAMRRYLARDVTGEAVPDLRREFRFLGPDGRAIAPGQAPVERALRGEVVPGVEASLQLADGRRIDVLDSVAPLLDPDGHVREVAVVLTDVTPLKELDRAKDQFISMAAHELRNPLTSLRGHAQILLRRAEKAHWPPADRRAAEVIDDQVDHLDLLIGRLLDVSRIRLGRLQLRREPTDIVALARSMVADTRVRPQAPRIQLQAEPQQLVGFWDPAALRQVLSNLIDNAIKYAPGSPIEVGVRREGDWALVSVTDHGPGIPAEKQSRLFEAFARGAAEEYRRGGGLGLGLYISRGIVEAHGGRIWVESRVGVGSTFTFSLPLSPGRPRPRDRQGNASGLPQP